MLLVQILHDLMHVILINFSTNCFSMPHGQFLICQHDAVI